MNALQASTSSTIQVVISDAKVSNDPAAVLTTHSLGSCIGVCVYDPAVTTAGMLHFQLPSSSLDARRATERPSMFADTGMQQLLGMMQEHGAVSHRMKVKLAGGAEMLNDGTLFSIGRRNHTAIRKVLWQHGLLITGEDVGGTQPRTLHMRVADGVVMVNSQGNRTIL
jgi:chemotaxis protein CheD